MTLPAKVIVAYNPSPMTLGGTRTYVVGEREVVVIDPGPALAEHLDAVAAAVAGARRVEIVTTHGHEDHAGGVSVLAERIGGRPGGGSVSVSPAGTLEDGRELWTDVGRLRAIATPGHTPDHVALLWERDHEPGGRAIFVGDLLLGAGDTALVASPEGSVRDYLLSLDRIEALAADVLFPAHGPPLTNPREAIERFRSHRLARVDQVRSATVQRPDLSADALVEVTYGKGLDPRVRDAARASIEAALEYLNAR